MLTIATILLSTYENSSSLSFVAGTLNSDDRPGYMKPTSAAARRDRHIAAAILLADSDDVTPTASKRRSASLKELDSGGVPSYMKPTNR